MLVSELVTQVARNEGFVAQAPPTGPGMDIPVVIRQQYWISLVVGPGPLFSATQRAARKLTGRDAGCYPPLTWPCPGCGQQITDLAPGGRPVHSELGHAAGCARLVKSSSGGWVCCGCPVTSTCQPGMTASPVPTFRTEITRVPTAVASDATVAHSVAVTAAS